VIQLQRATHGGNIALPQLLHDVLAAPHIAKLGVGIHEDAARLRAVEILKSHTRYEMQA